MTDGIGSQYERGNLLANILGGLAAVGRDPEHIGPDDLVMVEEFHALGPMATALLATAAGLSERDHVLDAGCGIGGPARHIARSHGCLVTGLDATAEFCEAARELTRRSGLSERVRIVDGDALALPFPDATFEVAWTQHASMNIANKAAFYAEMHRVLRPGGRLAFFDVVAGPEQPILFPVPWASEPAWNFLTPPGELRDLLTKEGFEVRTWEDVTDQATAFFAMAATAPGPPGPLGIHLLVPDPQLRFATFHRNLVDDRVRVLRCVASI